jgi:hypothetical protein
VKFSRFLRLYCYYYLFLINGVGSPPLSHLNIFQCIFCVEEGYIAAVLEILTAFVFKAIAAATG